MGSSLDAFFWGALGSIAVELFRIDSYFRKRGAAPARYRNKKYIIGRILLAAVGGGMAIAYYSEFHIPNKLLYLHVGATSPLFYEYFSRKKK